MFARSGLRFATRLRCAAPPQRALNVHEYQSKQLMQKFNINVQRNSVAIVGGATPEQAADVKQKRNEFLLFLFYFIIIIFF